jgi:hypothetical protein
MWFSHTGAPLAQSWQQGNPRIGDRIEKSHFVLRYCETVAATAHSALMLFLSAFLCSNNGRDGVCSDPDAQPVD